MESEKSGTQTPEIPGVPPARRMYRKPEILDFGNVRELTQGGGSKGSEPMTGNKRF